MLGARLELIKQQCVKNKARLRRPLRGCCWELRPIKAAALPYKHFGGWRSMTSCAAPSLSAKTKREISLSHYSKQQSTTDPPALWYSAVPSVKYTGSLALVPGCVCVCVCAAESGRGIRPSVRAMADGEAAVSVERDSGDGGLAE